MAALRAEVSRLQRLLALHSPDAAAAAGVVANGSPGAADRGVPLQRPIIAGANDGRRAADGGGGGGGEGALATAQQKAEGREERRRRAEAEGRSAEMSDRMAESVELATQLGIKNAQLREAADALADQREELERQQAVLMGENSELRDKLGLLELALAMESYPTAPPASLGAQIERQLRAAALELSQLRAENATLRDAAAAHAVAAPTVVPAAEAFPRRPGKTRGRGASAAGYGSQHDRPPPRPPKPPPAQQQEQQYHRADSITPRLSSTGEFHPEALLRQLAARPPSAGRPGSGGGARATVPRLTAQPTASTFEELDNLASLLRKRAALTAERSSGRPSTAAR